MEAADRALDHLDAYARAARLAEAVIEDSVERWAVVHALVDRVVHEWPEEWPQDVPLAGAGHG